MTAETRTSAPGASDPGPSPTDAPPGAAGVSIEGRITRVNGPLVEVEGIGDPSIGDVIEVGPDRLAGEIVSIRERRVMAQVYEYTGGLKVGDAVLTTGRPLSARLGPGLLGGLFDGLLRPLDEAGDLLVASRRTTAATPRTWAFTPSVVAGQTVSAGDLLGWVNETAGLRHPILVPPGVEGIVANVSPAADCSATDVVAMVGDVPVALANSWSIRRPRPFAERLSEAAPLITGQRILDLLFPLARGSTAAVPGGFGTGKTILLQQIAKWCDADVIVYVGCGERGNELADTLEELRALVDPRTGRPLMERTVIIANTSNMPVMAREVSVYTGVAVAEYYRDLGYDTVVIADSTSRWAEALREFASRQGALPVEEGYPAELASNLAAFYERAGRVRTLAGSEASVTIIGAVSPPGGDRTEPVTSHTRRFVRTCWSLDRDLAAARRYPAIGWRDSFARDSILLDGWYTTHGAPDWARCRARAMELLSSADRLASVAELVGAGALPDRERVVLLAADLLRDAVLVQSAVSPNDAFCGVDKQAALLDGVLRIYDRCLALIAGGVPATLIEEVDISEFARASDEVGPNDAEAVRRIADSMLERLGAVAP